MSTPAQQAAAIASAHGTPYIPQEQGLGLTPSVLPDVPVAAVFLFLFTTAAATHMFLLKYNARKGKKFVLCGMLFGFCFTRIFANSARIAWAVHPTSVKLGIAAQVAVYAGIILLFLANLFFTQRIVRAHHPHVGWSTPFSIALPILFVIIVGTILALIVAVIYSFYTLDPFTLHAVHDIQLYGETLYATVAFLPIPVVLASVAGRRKLRNTKPVDKFGEGSMRAKVVIVLVSAVFLCLGASWRSATLYLPAIYLQQTPPWYFSKTCFYFFNFTIEWCIVAFWAIVRIDKRFYIPDGAKGPYSYGGGFTFAGEPGNEKIALANRQLGNRESMRHLVGSTATGWSQSGPGSRVSWGGSRRSLSRSSRVSWGGISREDLSAGIGEDGVHVMPYASYGHEGYSTVDLAGGGMAGSEAGGEGPAHHELESAADLGIDGVEAEMGWDPKTGRWALRPVVRRRSSNHYSVGEGIQRPQSTLSSYSDHGPVAVPPKAAAGPSATAPSFPPVLPPLRTVA
ncbi:hypothetical protein LTR62_005996 [Meristemomyces frigidus]|uniref:Uncharacterized protein n=1 Tax=Meristemomyces frigidus TaxID=1508187 RepID=A0AAN7THJ1_9PEZI|nr:hypothetical protein LTR62_005996 [Meristemomyces frigidus]